jgi:hypothetical protein
LPNINTREGRFLKLCRATLAIAVPTVGGVGKIVMAVALFLALVRAGDMCLFDGKYTDAAIFVAGQILQSTSRGIRFL